MSAERLQKIIAAAGVASRRKAEELISSGRVSVNGETVTELGSKADPDTDHIKVDGKLLRGPERHVYFMAYKPKGYVTTVTDPEGRPTIMDLMRGIHSRVYPVGRLDYMSEGLLLLTNDGELAQTLTHAASHVPKTYLVKVSGRPKEEDIERLRNGVTLPVEPTPSTWAEGERRRSEEVKTGPARIELFRDAENPWYQVTLIEGRNRQIRRMFELISHRVEKIKRVRYGPLELDLEPGKIRPLSSYEVARLQKAAKSRDWDYRVGNEFGVKKLVPKRPPASAREGSQGERRGRESARRTGFQPRGDALPRRSDRKRGDYKTQGGAGDRGGFRPRDDRPGYQKRDDRRSSTSQGSASRRERPTRAPAKRSDRPGGTAGFRPRTKDELGRGGRPKLPGSPREERPPAWRKPEDRPDTGASNTTRRERGSERRSNSDWARGAGPTGPRSPRQGKSFGRSRTTGRRSERHEGGRGRGPKGR